LIAPGSSFNVPYRNHFRLTLLPLSQQLQDVFQRIEEVLETMQSAS
ncbi:MAG: pyridoxal phosphate-dependent aminotransferase, partial [Xanthomonadales bacterium]|nr:pyridoxal phosphate-dependent aminotransferase [Xanthomonadales bacterium]